MNVDGIEGWVSLTKNEFEPPPPPTSVEPLRAC